MDKKEENELKSYLARQHNEEERKKKERLRGPITPLKYSKHALQRFKERLEPLGYTIDDITKDIKFGWQSIKLHPGDALCVNGRLANYVLSRERNVITMYLFNERPYLILNETGGEYGYECPAELEQSQ